MKTFRIMIAALVGLVLVIGSAAHAQIPNTPLILHMRGELWSLPQLDGEPVRLTNTAVQPDGFGFVDMPAVSPDGNRIAYTISAPQVIDALRRLGGLGGGPLPNDVYVMDLTTGEVTQLAEQLPGTTFFDEDPATEDSGIIRSMPTWSPDGTQIAWTEMFYPGGRVDLVVYDFASGMAPVIATDLPGGVGIPSPLTVRWGEPGLLVRTSSLREDSSVQDELMFFTPDGVTSNRWVVGSPELFLLDAFWVYDNNTPAVLGLFNDGSMQSYDAATGTALPVPGQPELYSRLAGGDSLRVRLLNHTEGFNWGVFYPDGSQLGAFTHDNFRPEALTISPAGDIAAEIGADMGGQTMYGTVYTYPAAGGVGTSYTPGNGESVVSIVWGPTLWRIDADYGYGTPVSGCNALAARLTAGGQAQVLPGDANNVRAVPGTAGEVIGLIPAGAVFSVVEGPQCVDGLNWWRVTYEGIEGWTAEGDGTIYWVEPIG